MESIFPIALTLTLGYWLFTKGKQTGSRDGFRAGWRKARRHTSRRR